MLVVGERGDVQQHFLVGVVVGNHERNRTMREHVYHGALNQFRNRPLDECRPHRAQASRGFFDVHVEDVASHAVAQLEVTVGLMQEDVAPFGLQVSVGSVQSVDMCAHK